MTKQQAEADEALHDVGKQRDQLSRALRGAEEELLRARPLLLALARQLDMGAGSLWPGKWDPVERKWHRISSQAPIPEDFDEQTYLLMNSDVAADVERGHWNSGYEHWLTCGRAEGRLTRLNIGNVHVPPHFDEDGYLAVNPDVADMVAQGSFSSGYEHWTRFGLREGRPLSPARSQHSTGAALVAQSAPVRDGNISDSSALEFDEETYALMNPDVRRAVKKGVYRSCREHWLKHGRAERRGGSPLESIPDRRRFLDVLASRRFGVNLYGILSAVSGLGSVGRGAFKALKSASIPFHAVDVPSWGMPNAARGSLPAESYRINLIQQNADMLPLFFQRYGRDLINGCYNLGYWLWELPSARPDWHDLYRYVDEVWVASEFSRHSFQTLTRLPVKTIPLVVDSLEEKAIYDRRHFDFPQDVFVFCYVFDVSSLVERKNPFCLIDAFRRAFQNSRDVLLFLKYSNSSHDAHRVRVLQEMANAPNIRTCDRVFSDEEITSLHKVVDCFVSPHRSEGFGFNLAETMYFGKPVIGTGYSGNLDFMNAENSYLIEYELKPLPESYGPYLEGSVWAEPSVEHLSVLLRKVFSDPQERVLKGQRAAATIRANHSKEAVGRLIRKRFNELGLDEVNLSPARLQLRTQPTRPERLFPADVPKHIIDEIRGFSHNPVISIITPHRNVEPRYLRECIESVRAQYYPFWELCLCDDGSTNTESLKVLAEYQGTDPRIKVLYFETNRGIAGASNRAAEISSGEFLGMLDSDDTIAPNALFEITKAMNINPEIDLLYTDEDKIDSRGNYCDHYFKPDWSPEHLQSVMYILHMLTIRKTLFYKIGRFRTEISGSQDYDLALRAASFTKQIHHVPKVLYHWRKIEGSAAAVVEAKPGVLEAARRALEDHLLRNNVDAVALHGKLRGLFRVKHRIAGNPAVTLCITTDDRDADVPGRGRINLVEKFVKSIVEKTAYRNYEILIVDNHNLSARTQKALRDVPHRVASYTGPQTPFNFARKANFSFRKVATEHLVLLNDDLEVISPEWLEALLEFSQQEQIGAVGAKLLFPDNTIQHVGVVLGVNGGAAHIYHGYPGDFIGYNGYTHLIRNYLAVTGACMATRKSVVEAVNGFDEQLAIDYNDINFCLSAVERGYRIVYTPYCEMYHFEGSSAQRREQNPQERALFVQRWAKYMDEDPYYNRNLTRNGVDFAVSPDRSNWPAAEKVKRAGA